jgi:predicted alpha/beta-fold hydrolase
MTLKKEKMIAHLEAADFAPPRVLRGGNRQTLINPLFRKRRGAPFRLERWTTPDGDFLRVHSLEGKKEGPVALILHGLEGSVRSPYVQGLSRYLNRGGYTVVAMEHRSCGGEMNRARRLYHLGETSDIAFMLHALEARFPGRPIVVAGFSAGGNQLAKFLGEKGDALQGRVAAAAVVSAPYDLCVSAPNIDRIFGGFYTWNFLRTLIPKVLEKERQYPGCVDRSSVRRARTFVVYDTVATAALHGFKDAWDYWRRVSCGQFLPEIRVPTLLLSARDDPFNPGDTLPEKVARQSPWLIPRFVDHGGHVGFFHFAPRGRMHWSEAQMRTFFDLALKDRERQ